MDGRAIEILIRIIRNPYHYSYLELSEVLDRSERTIRNDITKVNEFLIKFNLDTIKVDNMNKLYVQTNEDRINRIINSFTLFDYVPQKEDKIYLIAILMLCREDFVTINEIANFMVISRSTVISNMENVVNLFKENNITLESQAGKGILIKGDEKDKRLLFLKIIIEHYYLMKVFINHNKILKLCPNLNFDKEKCDKIRNLITLTENKFEVCLNEKSFEYLYTYIYITLYRMKMGMVISDYKENNISSCFTDTLYKMIISFFNLEYCIDEKNMLAKFVSYMNFDERMSLNDNIIKIQTLTRKFIKNVSEEVEIDFNIDYELFESLSIHLESIFSDINLDLKNDLDFNDIKAQYSSIYKAVKDNKYIFEDFIKRSLSENEIVYIMIYLCSSLEKMKENKSAVNVVLICNSGIGSSQLLKRRLLKYFNINIISVISLRKSRNYNFSGVDFVITTIDVIIDGIRCIKVSSFVSDSDYLKISKVIDEIELESSVYAKNNSIESIESENMIKNIRKITSNYDDLSDEIEILVRNYFESKCVISEQRLSDFLDNRFVELDVRCSNWKEAVRYAGNILYRYGYIKEIYIDAMIESIEEYGPYIVLTKGLAIPHASVNCGTIKTGFSFIRLEKPISFGAGDNDPVEFICCLSSVDNKKHLKAFFNLVNMFTDNTFKEKVRRVESSDELLTIIEKYEKKFC